MAAAFGSRLLHASRSRLQPRTSLPHLHAGARSPAVSTCLAHADQPPPVRHYLFQTQLEPNPDLPPELPHAKLSILRLPLCAASSTTSTSSVCLLPPRRASPTISKILQPQPAQLRQTSTNTGETLAQHHRPTPPSLPPNRTPLFKPSSLQICSETNQNPRTIIQLSLGFTITALPPASVSPIHALPIHAPPAPPFPLSPSPAVSQS